jgi:5-methylcytosine-specific restriction endonuclease McrBC GTP-binding regulatory subunit McrB
MDWKYIENLSLWVAIENGELVSASAYKNGTIDVEQVVNVDESAFTKDELKEFTDHVQKATGWKLDIDYTIGEVPGKNKLPDYLFIGVYPNAYIYCDRTKEIKGDYHRIATVCFCPLSLSISDDAPQYKEAIERATKDYNEIKANPTKPIVISAVGQTTLPCLPEEE